MDADTATRIEQLHGPSITWRGGTVTYVCLCGAVWPCQVYLLADDYRQQHRLARSVQQQECR
jgi:hypothetical protein